jgi:hypothetical protein
LNAVTYDEGVTNNEDSTGSSVTYDDYVTYNENTVYLSENIIQTLATGKPIVITNEAVVAN